MKNFSSTSTQPVYQSEWRQLSYTHYTQYHHTSNKISLHQLYNVITLVTFSYQLVQCHHISRTISYDSVQCHSNNKKVLIITLTKNHFFNFHIVIIKISFELHKIIYSLIYSIFLWKNNLNQWSYVKLNSFELF